MKTKPEKKDNWLNALGLSGVIIGDIVGFTGVGIGLGYLFWKKLNAPWWVFLLSTIIGLILAFVQIYKRSIQIQKKE